LKNKVIGIVLLLCLAVPLIGTHSRLRYQKKLVRREVKKQIISGINQEELALLRFALSEVKASLSWTHSKEFEFNGQMYDVVETKIFCDSIYYWCWWDHKETELNKQLKNLVTHAFDNNLQKKATQKRLVDFYQSLYHSKTNSFQILICQTGKETCIYFFNWQSVSWPPPVPPPKLS